MDDNSIKFLEKLCTLGISHYKCDKFEVKFHVQQPGLPLEPLELSEDELQRRRKEDYERNHFWSS